MNQLIEPSHTVEPGVVRKVANVLWDFDAQCLRVLRCTAHALANSPGGLRFKAGTRPWLDAISHSMTHSVAHGVAGRDKVSSQ